MMCVIILSFYYSCSSKGINVLRRKLFCKTISTGICPLDFPDWCSSINTITNIVIYLGDNNNWSVMNRFDGSQVFIFVLRSNQGTYYYIMMCKLQYCMKHAEPQLYANEWIMNEWIINRIIEYRRIESSPFFTTTRTTRMLFLTFNPPCFF